ncbi:hypothetical protein ACA910_004157 [Epithemia clementina (nom. ined.)]
MNAAPPYPPPQYNNQQQYPQQPYQQPYQQQYQAQQPPMYQQPPPPQQHVPIYQQPPPPPPQQDYYNIASRGATPSNMYPPQVQPQSLRAGGSGGMGYQRPPYVDPETNIVYDTSNAEYEGWLTKQSAWLKEWRRRYFILKGSKLFFAKNEYGAPHGMMDLASCTTVKSADLKSKKRHSFEISTPETQYLLYADTESQKDDWIGRVGKAIVRCSRTYYDQSTNGSNTAQQHASDAAHQEVYQYNEEDDDIYTNDDPNNPYFND